MLVFQPAMLVDQRGSTQHSHQKSLKPWELMGASPSDCPGQGYHGQGDTATTKLEPIVNHTWAWLNFAPLCYSTIAIYKMLLIKTIKSKLRWGEKIVVKKDVQTRTSMS